jgi:phage/conjugal plasmid C-4 type zinc finger TraR family protein
MDERFHEMAAELEQNQRDDAIARAHRLNNQPGQPYCDDCGELIPQARRNANPAAIRCITCQNVFEHIRKGIHHERA